MAPNSMMGRVVLGPTLLAGSAVGEGTVAAPCFLDAFKATTAPPPTAAPRAKKAARMTDEVGMAEDIVTYSYRNFKFSARQRAYSNS